jgi:hypothetical protein
MRSAAAQYSCAAGACVAVYWGGGPTTRWLLRVLVLALLVLALVRCEGMVLFVLALLDLN